MERPLSSRADISREIREWGKVALALVVICLAGKVIKNIGTFGQALGGFMDGGKNAEDTDAAEDFEDPK